MSPAALRKRARAIRALACDVDGVLTDGGLWLGASGETLRRFHVRDGMGIRLLREAGYALALISGEESDAIRRRAEKLKIPHVYQGIEDKAAAFQDFLSKTGLKAEEVAYAGEAAPPGAVAEVRRAAQLVLKTPGGEGAVRELCDFLLESRKSR